MSTRKRSLSASSASRWFGCSASVDLVKNVPRAKDTEFSTGGTNAHQFAEECIALNVDPMTRIGDTIEVFNRFSKDNEGTTFAVTEDMATAVKVYTDWFDEMIEGVHDSNFDLEVDVDLSFIAPNMGSFIDCRIKYPFDTLIVADYKHGAGDLVSPRLNHQLLQYAIGACWSPEKQAFDKYEKIVIVIIQPRSWNSEEQIKEWVITFDELMEWVERFRASAIATVCTNNYNIGEWCKYCDAKAWCKENEKQLVPLTENINSVQVMALEKCLAVVVNEDRIKQLIKACKARVEIEVLDYRKKVPGFKVVKNKRSKKWLDPSDVARTLLDDYDERLLYKQPELNSPAQMIKSIGLEAVEPLLAPHRVTYTVAKSTDKRKEVDLDEIDPIENGGDDGLNISDAW